MKYIWVSVLKLNYDGIPYLWGIVRLVCWMLIDKVIGFLLSNLASYL